MASPPRLALAQQQAEQEEARAVAALGALSQELQAATQHGESPERLKALQIQVAELVERVQRLQARVLSPPD
jgi:hypothetical protein